MAQEGLAGPGKVRVNKAGCLDRCAGGPVVVVYPEAVWYTYVDKDDIDEENAVQQHNAYYNNNNGGNQSNQSGGSGNMGAAAAMQAMKMFSGGSGGKSDQNQLIGIAMGEAAKLFGKYLFMSTHDKLMTQLTPS